MTLIAGTLIDEEAIEYTGVILLSAAVFGIILIE